MLKIRHIRQLVVIAVVLITSVVAANADAAIAISTAGFGPTKIVDFSQFTSSLPTSTPLQVGTLVVEDIVFSGGNGAVYNGSYGLGGNGTWDSGRAGYVIIDEYRTRTLRFDFNDGPVAGVGGLFNNLGSRITLTAFDANNNQLESADLFVSTPNGYNIGAFQGFLRDTADIHAIEILGDHVVFDDLTFSRSIAAVPEAGSLIVWSLVAMSIGGGCWLRNRKSAV